MVRDSSGRFPERPFFPEGEIEDLMQEVLRAGGTPRLEGVPAIDVDQLMLNLDLEAHYITLPAGVLGSTVFAVDGAPSISVSAHLEETSRYDTNALHRLRTTQAHELGHAILHAPLYVERTISSKLESIVTLGSLTCDSTYMGEWWEFQANSAMASLVLPETDVREEAVVWRSAKRRGRSLADWISERFCVSKMAARIRLGNLKLK